MVKNSFFLLTFKSYCFILFSVMRDRIELEEIFEADPKARAEFDAVCDQLQNEAIAAQEAEMSTPEMAPEPVLADGVDLGRLFDRMRAPRDWNGKEWADAVYGPKKP